MAKNDKGLKSFIGKEVQLYPGDTYKKFAIIESVDEFGVTLKITEGDSRSKLYQVNDIIFFNHAKKLSFKLR
jgi:hypothetical protein